MNRQILVAILFAWGLIGCEAVHQAGQDLPPAEPGKFKTTVGFQQIKDEILTPYCISCHGGRHAAYENYSIVRGAAQNILFRVTAKDSQVRMPPRSAGLPPELIAKLTDWVAAGAPEVAVGPEEPQSSPAPPATALGFHDIKQKILRPHCMGCHTHYGDFAVVKNSLGSIFSLIMKNEMPFARKKNEPSTPLPEDLKQMLADWVNGGAPEYPGGSDRPVPLPELEPTWLSLRNRVFGPKCILCHNSYGPRAPKAMGTYRELLAWADKNKALFNVKKPIDSHFIGAILGRIDDDELFFDSMPFNSPRDDVPTDIPAVTPAELQVIQTWISLDLPFQ